MWIDLTISNSKKKYLIAFIDDVSRKIWIYFLTKKSEAFVVFKSFKVNVEKETNSFIRTLRIDQGGEFTSKEFEIVFCDVNGIGRQLTVAYTAQQTGLVEMKNRTIMNMVYNMILEKNSENLLA